MTFVVVIIALALLWIGFVLKHMNDNFVTWAKHNLERKKS